MTRTPSPRLAYSMNVHRGETLSQVYESLHRWTIPVARRVFGEEESGVELRLGIGSARQLESKAARADFRGFLRDNRLVPISVNAYPLRDFHATRVKEKVYLPSWDEPERCRWTNMIAGILADLLPEGGSATISTLGGKFRPAGHDSATLRRIAAGYSKTVRELVRIREDTGKTILLAVEPEPDTTFETAHDVIEFFERFLLPVWKQGSRARPAGSERLLRKHFTVNFDACHFSVLFENLVDSLEALQSAGLDVGKFHVTSAIVLKNPYRARRAYGQFRQMHEPRYFHQFCGRGADGRPSWRGLDLDGLPRTLVRGRHPEVVELRAHYHVPLHRKTWGLLGTTREETGDLVREVLRKGLDSQLVIETYTWPLLREEERLTGGIVREFSWLLGVLGEEKARKPARKLRAPD